MRYETVYVSTNNFWGGKNFDFFSISFWKYLIDFNVSSAFIFQFILDQYAIGSYKLTDGADYIVK